MHPLTDKLYQYLRGKQNYAITVEQHHHIDSLVRSHFFADELRFRAEGAIASARQEGEDNGFPLPPDRALMIVIDEAVKLYSER